MEKVSRFKTFREFIELAEVTLGAGENYGSKGYQKRLKDEGQKEAEERAATMQRLTDAARTSFRHGEGIRAVHKGQSGYMKDGKFTPDT